MFLNLIDNKLFKFDFISCFYFDFISCFRLFWNSLLYLTSARLCIKVSAFKENETVKTFLSLTFYESVDA